MTIQLMETLYQRLTDLVILIVTGDTRIVQILLKRSYFISLEILLFHMFLMTISFMLMRATKLYEATSVKLISSIPI